MIPLALTACLAALPVEPLLPGSPAVLRGHTDAITAIAFSPDGAVLATGSRDKSVRLWSLESGKVIATIPDAKEQPNALAFSKDGKRLAIGDSSLEVRIVELPAGTVAATWLHPDAISEAVFDGPAERLLVTGFNGNAALYAVKDGKKLLELRAISGRFLPDGKELLLVSPEGPLKIVDAKSGKAKRELKANDKAARVLLSADASVLLTWSPRSGDVQRWDRKAGKVASTLSGPSNEAVMPEKRERLDAVSAALAPDGARVLVSYADRSLRLVEVSSGAVKGQFSVQQPSMVALSPDARWIAAGDGAVAKLFALTP